MMQTLDGILTILLQKERPDRTMNGPRRHVPPQLLCTGMNARRDSRPMIRAPVAPEKNVIKAAGKGRMRPLVRTGFNGHAF
jgi:hypothetical protein